MPIARRSPHGAIEGYDDHLRVRRCKHDGTACVALLSAAHHGGLGSQVSPRHIGKIKQQHEFSEESKLNLRRRILLRVGYCTLYDCDVIIDYNQYNANRTMWLSNHGHHQIKPMPPHFNKVASLRRWLPHYDAVVLLDMDTIWVDFSMDVRHIVQNTPTIRSHGNAVGWLLFKRCTISYEVAEAWYYWGTMPGCRYVKYPQNHMGQTQNLDMPWFWFALTKVAEIYKKSQFECLDPCYGPQTYVNHLFNTENHSKYKRHWVHNCMGAHRKDIDRYVKQEHGRKFEGKQVNINLQWGLADESRLGVGLQILSHCTSKTAGPRLNT